MSGSATLTMLKSSTTTAWAPRTTARPRPASAAPRPDPVASLSLTDSSALLFGRADEELVDCDVHRYPDVSAGHLLAEGLAEHPGTEHQDVEPSHVVDGALHVSR